MEVRLLDLGAAPFGLPGALTNVGKSSSFHPGMGKLQWDPLWQKLQPAQGGMRQLPIVLLVGGLGGCVVLGNNSFQFSVFKNKPVESR